MPVENERKYLLAVEDGAAASAADRWRARLGPGTRLDRLEQAWIDGSRARVRRVQPEAGPAQHLFTWKRQVGARPIEIETGIDPEDFDALFGVADRSMRKLRLTPPKLADELWCLDLLPGTDDRACLLVAEVEMPEGRVSPLALPPWLDGRVLHAAPAPAEWANQTLAEPGALDRAITATRRLEQICRRVPAIDQRVLADLWALLGGPGGEQPPDPRALDLAAAAG
jgi:hypothetical protein